jgi:hypothetical protein
LLSRFCLFGFVCERGRGGFPIVKETRPDNQADLAGIPRWDQDETARRK